MVLSSSMGPRGLEDEPTEQEKHESSRSIDLQRKVSNSGGSSDPNAGRMKRIRLLQYYNAA